MNFNFFQRPTSLGTETRRGTAKKLKVKHAWFDVGTLNSHHDEKVQSQDLSPHTHTLTPSNTLSGRLAIDNGSPEISLWLLDRRIPVVALAVLGCLIAIPLLRKMLSLDGQWFSERPYMAWALLGVLWWVCLTPSFLGMLLVIVAGLVAVRSRQRRSKLQTVTSQ